MSSAGRHRVATPSASGPGFRRQIAAAVDAVRVHSSGSFTFCGIRTVVAARHRGTAALPPHALRGQLCDAIADRLYTGYYSTGVLRPASATGSVAGSRRAPMVAAPWPDEHLVLRLSEANAGAGPWIPGWRFEGFDPGGDPIVWRQGLSMVAPASECRLAGGAVGDERRRRIDVRGRDLEVRHPKELLGASPGFYVALGDAAVPEGGAMLRVYWNLRASGAVPFVRLLTTAFNRLRIPFELKVPHHPAGFARRDAGVLYLPRASYPSVLPCLRSVHRELLPHLRRGVPALTFPVGLGVSVAEDPPGGDSFGTARCGLLAEGMVRAHELRSRHPDRLEPVLAALRAAGVDPERPYLNPGSSFEPTPLTRVAEGRFA
jgi:hypothetical protein